MILLLNTPAKTKPGFRRKKAANHQLRCILFVICSDATGPTRYYMEFCRNISRNYSVYSGHLLGRSPIKAESWRELCQIVRHLGSEMIRNARLRQRRPRGAAALDLNEDDLQAVASPAARIRFPVIFADCH